MQAKDVMTTAVLSVRPSTPVREIAKLMLDHQISGVPVTDANGHVLGVATEGDLLRRTELGTERRRPWWLKAFTDDATLADEYARAHGLTADDVMTRPAVTTDADASLDEIVSTMERRRIKRMPVVRDGTVVGIISRANLLRAFASAEPKVDTGDNDRAIRAALLNTLDEQPWATVADNSVVVANGIVNFWGTVASDEERRALRVAAEQIPGVKAVRDHTTLRSIAFPGFGAI